jgi:general stress protein 26
MLDRETETTILNIISAAESVALSTIDSDGAPATRAMLNLSDNTLKEIWFTTNTSSRKVEQIKKNSKGSAYFCLPKEWRGVLLNGTINVVESLETKHEIWRPDWSMYYPKGVEDPDFTLLLLQPEKGYLYNQMQKSEFSI